MPLKIIFMIKIFSLKKFLSVLPKRKKDAHKNAGGKTLVIAGSPEMPGACILCATAASRVGSGYVYILKTSKYFISKNFPDFLIVEKSSLKKTISNYSALAIGPGLGKSAQNLKILKTLIKSQVPFVVVDADGLNMLASLKNVSLPETWILTPHEGELARLLKTTAQEIRQNRKKYVIMAQKKFKCHILLKGNKTLIASKKHLVQIQTGNKALAKAGTGDVLTGMIAGFLAQGLNPLNAACVAATLHGKIADDWITKRDYLGFMASDLLTQIPLQMKKMRAQSSK